MAESMKEVDPGGYRTITENLLLFCRSNVDAVDLGNLLVQKSVIDFSLLETIRQQQNRSEKLSILTGAVLRNGRPGVFERFLDCLSEERSNEWLVEKLKGIETFCIQHIFAFVSVHLHKSASLVATRQQFESESNAIDPPGT